MFRLAFAATIAAVLFGGSSAMVSVSPGSNIASAAAQTLAASASVASPQAVISLSIEKSPDGLAAVTAKIEPTAGEARTLLLQMYDGEEATLALPGHPGTTYHFRRSGDVVTARIDS